MTKERIWRAVRCCCRPQKILGFMLIGVNDKQVTLFGSLGSIVGRVKVETFYTRPEYTFDVTRNQPILDSIPPRTHELAIRSDDFPIELWRIQTGFIEVSHDHR